MTSTRLALLLSLATVAAWTAKSFAISAAGGLGRSPLEGPFFLAGLVLAVAATAVTGWALARPRRIAVRLLSVFATIVVVSLLGTLAQLAVTATQPSHPSWVWGELNLWLIAVVLLGVNLVLAGLRRPASVQEPARSDKRPVPDRA